MWRAEVNTRIHVRIQLQSKYVEYVLRIAVGNAMCITLSKAIVLSAVAIQNGEASVPGEAVTAPAAPSPAPTKTPCASEVSYKQYRRLRRRVDDLERMAFPDSAH